MKAILIGATGATGNDLLKLLLSDDRIERVDIFVRRAVNIEREKLNVHIIDFDKPEEWKSHVKGDILFSCLGTTLKDAGSKDAQWKVDHEYQYLFAKIAKENKVPSYILVSAANAWEKSPFFYSRMKGKLEEDVKKLGFQKLAIFKPPLLIRENSNRKMEVLGAKAIRLLNKMGFLHSQKPLSTSILAKAMLNAAKKSNNGVTILKGKKILDLATD